MQGEKLLYLNYHHIMLDFVSIGKIRAIYILSIVNEGMEIKIIKREKHGKGEIYTIKVKEEFIKILFLFHAIERMKKWGIKESMVLETLIFPEEVLKGHGNRYIAHRRYGEHLVRSIYEYEDYTPVLITVYFPYLNRYFAGGGIYEDKIFKGS